MEYELYQIHNRTGHMTYWSSGSIEDIDKECRELNQHLIDTDQMGPLTFNYWREDEVPKTDENNCMIG